MRTTMIYVRIAFFGAIAYVSGALTIDWLGTSWWARIVAALTVLLTMSGAMTARPEVPGASS